MGSDRRSSSRKHVSEYSRTGRPAHISNAKENSWKDWWSTQCWFYILKRAFFSWGSFVVYLWRQRSSDQDDHQGKKSDNETRFQNPQSCSWLVVRSNQLGHQNPNQACWHQKPTRWHFNQRKFHAWRMESSFVFFSTLATSVLQIVLKWCQKERKKIQVKKESQQNQSRWWIWSHDTAWGIRTCLLQLHRKARWTPNLKVRTYLWVRWMTSEQEQGDLWWALAHQTNSEWNIDDKWSSQEWKSGEISRTSTGRPVYDKFVIDDDMDSDTAAESNMSLKSRSFLHRVNDRLRKKLDHFSKDAMQDIDKRSMIWWMFMSSTLEAWKQLSLVNDEEIISLSHAKVSVFADSVLCLGKVNENPASNTVWEEQLSWLNDSPQYRTLDTIDGEPMEFEWNIFPGFTTLQLVDEVQKFMNMSDPAQFQGQIIFMSMFNDIIWRTKDYEQECIANATPVSFIIKKISSRTLVIPRTWIRKEVVFYLQRKTTRRKGQSRWIDDDQIRRERTPSFPNHESIVPRNAQKQRRWKFIDTLLCRWGYDWNCFSHNYFLLISLVSTEQSQMCVWEIQYVSNKNGETRVGRTIWPIVWASKIIDNDTQTFDWDSCKKKNYCRSTKNEWKTFHNQINWLKFVLMQDSWRQLTLLHDKGHWRVLTIYRTSDMSWVHSSKRWKNIWPERLDSREHQNWTRVRSHNQLPAR